MAFMSPPTQRRDTGACARRQPHCEAQERSAGGRCGEQPSGVRRRSSALPMKRPSIAATPVEARRACLRCSSGTRRRRLLMQEIGQIAADRHLGTDIQKDRRRAKEGPARANARVMAESWAADSGGAAASRRRCCRQMNSDTSAMSAAMIKNARPMCCSDSVRAAAVGDAPSTTANMPPARISEETRYGAIVVPRELKACENVSRKCAPCRRSELEPPAGWPRPAKR